MIKIFAKKEINDKEFFARITEKPDVSGTVKEIIETVRKEGDAALLRYAEKFDSVRLETLEVSAEEKEEAWKKTDADIKEILEKAAANIREFHEKQKREGFSIKRENGVIVGQRISAIEKVGLYVPGGTAAYPSTVLMDAIPAKIAGCGEIIMVTPPSKDGKVSPYILAAARVAGVDRIFKTGGAQAIAALAYGTESVPKVYKIVGPGNAYVAEAKRQVYGEVSIDMIAGPSEILVVADEKANPAFVAADMLSQAEHDVNASAVLVTDSEELAYKVSAEIEKQLPLLKRYDIAKKSIDVNGKIIIMDNLEEVIDTANGIAPEHLELAVENPYDYLEKIRNAGSVFLGRYCPEAVGDYYAGANHTLPTGGTAKFSSALSVDDFVKKTQYVYYPETALKEDYKDIDRFAKCEGLTAHAESVTIRFREEK